MSAVERLGRKENDLNDVAEVLSCVDMDALETAARQVQCPPARVRAEAMLNLLAELEAYAEALGEAVERLEQEAVAEAAREQAVEYARYRRMV